MLLNSHERNGRQDSGDELDDQPVALLEKAIAVNVRQQTVVLEALNVRTLSMSSLRRGLVGDNFKWLATGTDERRGTLKATLSWLKHKEAELRAQKLSILLQDETEVQRSSNLDRDYGAYTTKETADESGDRYYSPLFLLREREREKRLTASSYFSSPTARSAAATALALSEAQRYASLALEEHSPTAFSKAAPIGPSPGMADDDTGSRRIGGRRRRLFPQGGHFYFKIHTSEPHKTGRGKSSSSTEVATAAAAGTARSAGGRVDMKEHTGAGGTGGGGSGDGQEKAPCSGTLGEGRYPTNLANPAPPIGGVGVDHVSNRSLEENGMVAAADWPPTAAETAARTRLVNTGNAHARRGESSRRKFSWRAMFLCWANCGDASYGAGSGDRGDGYSDDDARLTTTTVLRPSMRVVMRGSHQRAKSWRSDGSNFFSHGSEWSAETWPARPGGLEQGAHYTLSGSGDGSSGRSSRSSGTSGLSGSSGRSTGSIGALGELNLEIPPFKPKPPSCAPLALTAGSFTGSEAGKSSGSRGSADRTLGAPAPAHAPAGADWVEEGYSNVPGPRSRPNGAGVSAAGQTEQQTNMLHALKSYRGRRGRGGRGGRGAARADGVDEEPLLGRGGTEPGAEKKATAFRSLSLPRSLRAASSAVSSITVPSDMGMASTLSSTWSPSVMASEEESAAAAVAAAGEESGSTSGAKGVAAAAASAAALWQARGSFLSSPDSAAASSFSAASNQSANTNWAKETRPARTGRSSGRRGGGANHDAAGEVDPPAGGGPGRATESCVFKTTPAALAAALAAAMASTGGFEGSCESSGNL